MKKRTNKILITITLVLILQILCIILYILFDKKIYNENIITQTTKQTNEKIEQVIREYNLENIREKIYYEEDFFLEYMNIVFENGKIENYREHVFKIFEVLVDNKKHLNKEFLLKQLKELSIKKVEELEMETATGTFSYEDNSIEYIENSNKNSDSTIYHELMHFIDYSINKPDNPSLYITEDSYIFNYADLKGNILDAYTNDYNYLFTEGGAEKYKARYYNKNIPTVYEYEVNILTILSYIFGEETIKNIFFSPNTIFDFYSLLCIENKMNNKDFVNVQRSFDKAYNEDYNALDSLIDIYYLKNDNKWYEDKIFKEMIATISYNIESYDSKYKNEVQKHIKRKEMDEKIQEYINKLNYNNEKYQKTEKNVQSSLNVSVIDKKVYYVYNIYFEDFEDETYLIDIDFETITIKGYEKIKI